MAETLKRYCNTAFGTAIVTNALGTVGTLGGIIRNIHFCNTGTASVTVNFGIGGTAATAYSTTQALYAGFTIPANGVHVANVNIYLNASEKILGYASGTTVIATVSGVDL